MPNTVIRVENLSKKYRIGKLRGYKTFRETIMEKITFPFHRLSSIFTKHRANPSTSALSSTLSSPFPSSRSDEIWALKEVNFEVKQGEVVGIIGRNGAGKTTLLKILSRITAPTEGIIKLRGRVGSLLEVGTGFHPELTGRENIYLNGAILGMTKVEIKRKFDEIVDFAGTEKFLDTPIKRYSSGMYVRLAFAVAAYMEPEILLVDEVLAVGDVEFQKKCLGKMKDVAEGGRTVLFVSHNMAAIESLCNRALLIDQGRIKLSGQTHEVVSLYLAQNHKQKENPFSNCRRTGNGKIRILSFHLETSDGMILQVAKSGMPVVVAFEFENRGCNPKDRISFSFSVHNDREFGLFHYYSHFSGVYYENLPSRGYFKCLIPELPLAPGNYLVMCRVVMNGDHVTGEEVDWPQVFVSITVVGGDFYGTGDANLSSWGPILVKGTWSMVKVKTNK